ncbi:AMP-binding protein [Nocardioides daejeonensis]|uniref:AMP-binding protein n=1 Tax=Nocardioides daejeonensis TaxID=1046556 RepID=UPI000D74B9F0|nr:AMP-binding protein [Nocardioides daejeonensis]
MSLPLTIEHLLWRMEHVHHSSEVVAVTPDGTGRLSFPETAARARALAAGLRAGHRVEAGSVVAVLAFNTRLHLELMLGVPSLGAVLECVNIRTSTEVILDQLADSRPQVVVIETEALEHPTVGGVVRDVRDACRALGREVLLLDGRTGDGLEQLLAPVPPAARTPLAEEETAYLFHTSGTTGRPKTYRVTHRDVVLHALSQATTVAADLRPEDRVLPLAPFFHVNGWGLPFTCAVTGSDLVLTGSDATADTVVDVLLEERVTVAAAVPTVWYDVCEAVRRRFGARQSDAPSPVPALREVLTGGSAVPASVAEAIREQLDARVVAAWGMTETMACSTYERDQPSSAAGLPVPLVETRVVDPLGVEVPEGRGRLEVRGAFVVGARGDSVAGAGWMDTGDIASIDEEGRLRLHDRQKDLIKSGGEWIASAELEQGLCSHPAVSTAAVVARPDPRWMERPVAYVVLRSAGTATAEELLDHLAAEFPKWWLPDQITITDDLPRTAVGKIDKVSLRRAQGSPAADPVSGSRRSRPSINAHRSEVVA